MSVPFVRKRGSQPCVRMLGLAVGALIAERTWRPPSQPGTWAQSTHHGLHHLLPLTQCPASASKSNSFYFNYSLKPSQGFCALEKMDGSVGPLKIFKYPSPKLNVLMCFEYVRKVANTLSDTKSNGFGALGFWLQTRHVPVRSS